MRLRSEIGFEPFGDFLTSRGRLSNQGQVGMVTHKIRSRFKQNWGDRIVIVERTWCGLEIVSEEIESTGKECKKCKKKLKGYK